MPDKYVVRCCPYCSCKDIRDHVAYWPAFSEEDPINTAMLAECQCQACGRAFWVPHAPDTARAAASIHRQTYPSLEQESG